MVLVYAIRISQQMIVQLTFTKYRRFLGKSYVNCHLNSVKKSNKATLNLISNFNVVSAIASGYFFGDCIRNQASLPPLRSKSRNSRESNRELRLLC